MIKAKDIYGNIKEFLINIKQNHAKSELEYKVDNIVLLYKNNIKKIGFSNAKELRNFIEKIALWYELKYPEEKVREMINRNLCNVNLDENSVESNFYSEEAFIESLPAHEKQILQLQKYEEVCCLLPKQNIPCFILTDNGFIKQSFGMSKYTRHVINDGDIKNMHIKQLNKMITEKKILNCEKNQIEKMLNDIEYRYLLRLQILNCAMYRIIERGGNKIGPRRAFLFANDFKINIDEPMRYGVDLHDDELMIFINEYLRHGGSSKLTCYKNYFSNDMNDTICLNEVIEFLNKKDTKKIKYLKRKK